MQRIFTTLAVCLFAALAAQAQNPQPVKEMEKEARSAVHVSCNTSIATGYQFDWGDCTIYSGIANLGNIVPTGKILVIEDISAGCFKFNTDIWSSFYLIGTGITKHMPLQLVGMNASNGQNWISSLPARLYLGAGEGLRLYTRLQDHAVRNAQCGVRLQGHLVNAQ